MATSTMAGAEDVVRALATMRVEFTAELSSTVSDITQQAMNASRRAAPVRTGTLHDAIQMKTFDEGLTGVVFVAPRKDPNWNQGGKTRRRAAQFPLWIEYGTVKQQPHPFLMPAFRSMTGKFEQSCLSVARRLLERV